ncbi:MAG: hypothetical protein HYV63_07270 [Candidatus Schekmanbacteria bacterium]|nr:hypothetical protein [Candidatus Schekmanbacteria bacterium]
MVSTGCAASNAQPVPNAIRLNLECQDDSIIFGEPARFFVSVHNTSETTVHIYPGIIYNTRLLCSVDDNKYEDCIYGREWMDFGKTHEMLPGSALWNELGLYLNGTVRKDLERQDGYVNDLVFPRPGTYYVKAESDYAENLHSNAVRITVAPLPESEQPVMEIWSRPEVATFIQGYTYKEGVAPLERLLDQYPDSLYADHARYALGDYWAGQYFTKITSDPHILRKASVHFAAVTERVPILKMRALYQQLVIVDRKLFMSDEVDFEALARELEPRMSLADRIGLGEKIRERLPRVLARQKPTEAPGAIPR